MSRAHVDENEVWPLLTGQLRVVEIEATYAHVEDCAECRELLSLATLAHEGLSYIVRKKMGDGTYHYIGEESKHPGWRGWQPDVTAAEVFVGLDKARQVSFFYQGELLLADDGSSREVSHA